jgi:hypothetical protein
MSYRPIHILPVVFFALPLVSMLSVATAAPMNPITVDGDFSDWAAVPSYTDPVGTAYHDGIPDVHDTNHDQPGDVPSFVSHPDVDLLEFKFTHDAYNLYAYFRATGEIGRTASTPTQHGRYYVIVTIDVDNNDATGYGIHEGGYFPTSTGYDMNMEIEYYDGAFNTGHSLNHGATNQVELDAAIADQKNGVVQVLPGSYDYYSQWVWWDDPTTGDWPLPDGENSITFVADKGPVYQGIIEAAISPDGHELEMVAPFRGFMKDLGGDPIMDLGYTIDVSISLEASGELAPGSQWASDTGDPIAGYALDALYGDADYDGDVDVSDLGTLATNYGLTADQRWTHGDFDRDEDVDVSDLGMLATNYGTGTGPAPTPEPATILLLSVGGVLLRRRRRA